MDLSASKLVSIITPTYNCGKYIAETIESVLAQTYTNWEMLIVDDCSTDNTREIVGHFKDPRIKYYCLESNSGAAVCRNIALKLARGRWIAFLDSDDIWLMEKLEQQIKFMIDNNYSFTYHNYSEIDETGNVQKGYITGPNHIGKLKMFSYCWPGCLTVMYDRSKVGLIQIEPIKKNNDYALWLKVIRRTDCHLLNGQLAFYRRRQGSISNHSCRSLIKWHYKLFKYVEHSTSIVSTLLTVNNLFWGLYKKIFYIKR